MPAGLPGETVTVNTTGNPSAGRFITMDPLSGPKGSPFDARKPSGGAFVNDTANASTGGLNRGIGMSANPTINITPGDNPQTAPGAIKRAGYDDDYIPGAKPASFTPTTAQGNMNYIGGGRSIITAGFPPAGVAGCNPYTAGTLICGAGNAAVRDGTTSGRGFTMKMVTTTASTANGVAIEAGFENRTGVTLPVANLSAFGRSTAESVAPA